MIGTLKVATAWVVRPITHLVRLFKLAQSRRRAVYEVRAARGTTLLREWLSPQQRAQFDSFKFFDVIGCDSGKSYRIQYGMSANVIELDRDGRPHTGWCFVPAGNLVPGDVMLAQKIALETNERSALALARQFLVPPLPSRMVIAPAS
jgi:hypothetical protein